MFRHRGRTRTLKHNLKAASLLSFVAGMVNIAGFISVQRLTTNITGHFAFLIDNMIRFDFWQGLIYLLYIFFFFLGSFVSNVLIEFRSEKHPENIYIIPVLLEALILLCIGLFGRALISAMPDALAFSMLFAMGLQNSLVTTISNATVRTTHLTGLFTDLGIELSQLFFYKLPEQRKRLFSSIRLRLAIIVFFFLGGILGGLFYAFLQLQVLTVASILLFLGGTYDGLRLRWRKLQRRSSQKKIKPHF